MQFFGTSHAGNGTFVNYGGQATGAGGGIIFFRDSSNADHGNFTNNPGPADQSDRGSTEFLDSSNAGFGIFINSGGTLSGNYGGSTLFFGASTAGSGTFTNAGGTVSNAIGGFTQFSDTASAANASVTINGGTVGGALGATTLFLSSATAANATFTVNGGEAKGAIGGLLRFSSNSTAAQATIMVFGNGSLDISFHTAPSVAIGSIEGTGNVFLGSNNLIVGTNNLSTSFSGFIDDSQLGGGFTKIGAGVLTLQGRPTNNYLADTVSLSVITGSIINLNFAGNPDRIRSLIVDGVSQPPGLYGGPASGAPNQLPQFAGPGTILATTQAVSRKVHGAAGSFDVDLPLIGPPGIECRSGGGAYQIVVNFFNAVTFSSASVTSGVGMVASTSGNGTTTVTINLTGVANAQTITVTLFNVNDGTSISNLVIPMAVLVGDVNGNAVVNATDVALTKSQVGATVSGSNFREDVNANGTISSTDVAIVKSDVGTSLPP